MAVAERPAPRPPGRSPSAGEAAPPRRRRPLAGLPTALWVCAAIAFLNGAVWALLTPPFQPPDEASHLGYAQWIAETGRPPDPLSTNTARFKGRESIFSEEEIYLGEAVRFSVTGLPSWSERDDRHLRRQLSRPVNRKAETAASVAANNPPLYYYLAAIPYRATSWASFPDRLFAMRLLNALLGAITVAFCFLFVRELLPGSPWAWTVGALAVAFQPMFGHISGAVHNDSLLYTAGAGLLYLLAVCLRRGLTPGRGVAVGAVILIGVLGKQTMVALIPAAVVALAIAVWRAQPERRREAVRGAAVAAGVVALPALAWLAVNNLLLDRSAAVTGDITNPGLGKQVSWLEQLSYLWQFFLPRLPFMTDQFAGSSEYIYPAYGLWDVYVQGFIGRFGQFEYGFPMWANWVALGIFVAVIALAVSAVVSHRDAVRRRLPQLAMAGAAISGLLLVIAVISYRYRAKNGVPFEQARYVLPLLPLYAALVAVAARGAGRRWGPAVGAFLVVLAMGHSLFAMLLTVDRYYA
jgi:4-amino-4-deoxy-L-arabinose transferase-like glycosyltransferase